MAGVIAFTGFGIFPQSFMISAFVTGMAKSSSRISSAENSANRLTQLPVFMETI
jgi:hypothetical protein